MDERQQGIKEGAGLEESRINQELLDFLNKWSFPVLLVILVISAGYFAKNWFEQKRVAEQDMAFAEYGAVESSASPSVYSLTNIAEEFDGVKSVAELARLRAADLHLRAARTGISPEDGETELTEEDRAYHLDRAEELYRIVLNAEGARERKALIGANAAFGLAAVAMTRGDVDGAREHYETVKNLAEKAGYQPLVEVADNLASEAGDLPESKLYAQAELPRMPYEPEPQETPEIEAPAPDPDRPVPTGPEADPGGTGEDAPGPEEGGEQTPPAEQPEQGGDEPAENTGG